MKKAITALEEEKKQTQHDPSDLGLRRLYEVSPQLNLNKLKYQRKSNG